MTDLLNKLLKYHTELDSADFAKRVMSSIASDLKRRQIILTSCFLLGAAVIGVYFYQHMETFVFPVDTSITIQLSLISFVFFIAALFTFWIVSDPNELRS